MLGWRLMFWQIQRMFCMNINNKTRLRVEVPVMARPARQLELETNILEVLQIKKHNLQWASVIGSKLTKPPVPYDHCVNVPISRQLSVFIQATVQHSFLGKARHTLKISQTFVSSSSDIATYHRYVSHVISLPTYSHKYALWDQIVEHNTNYGCSFALDISFLGT